MFGKKTSIKTLTFPRENGKVDYCQYAGDRVILKSGKNKVLVTRESKNDRSGNPIYRAALLDADGVAGKPFKTNGNPALAVREALAHAPAPMSSNSKAAKNIIRAEITHYFSPKRKGGGKSALDNMERAANSYSQGRGKSAYGKGAALVNACCFGYGSDWDNMLSKIYGAEKVHSWDVDKRMEIYSHLVGREYSAMLSERERNRAAKAQKKAQAKAAKSASRSKRK